MKELSKEQYSEWLFARIKSIVDSCVHQLHFQAVDALIELYKRQEPDESKWSEIEQIRTSKWNEIHFIIERL